MFVFKAELVYFYIMDKMQGIEFLDESNENNNQGYSWSEVGKVTAIGDGVARVTGLDTIQAGEYVSFIGGDDSNADVKGIALTLTRTETIIAVFGNELLIGQGTLVVRRETLVGVPTGEGLLGRVVDALGYATDGKGAINNENLYAVDVKAPGIYNQTNSKTTITNWYSSYW